MAEWLKDNLGRLLAEGKTWDQSFKWLDEQVIPFQGYNEAQLVYTYEQLAGDLKTKYEAEYASLPTLSTEVGPDSLLRYGIDKLRDAEAITITNNVATYVLSDFITTSVGKAILRFTLDTVKGLVRAALPDGIEAATAAGVQYMDDAITKNGWIKNPDY